MDMPGNRDGNESRGYTAFVISAKLVVRVLIVIFFIVLLVFIAKKMYSLGYEVSSYKPSEAQEEISADITIEMGMSVEDVGKLLIDNKIIDESLEAFLIQEKLSDYHDKFIPGTYTLSDRMTVEEILEKISTVPEEEAP